jgi:hypothetical protein
MSKKTKEKFVTTINNEELPISQCRKYDSGFYKIGDREIENSGDCYMLDDGKYYRVETGGIIYDHSSKKYQQNSTMFVLGIINGDLEEGFFNRYSHGVIKVLDKNKNSKYCINREVLKNNNVYKERLSNGIFYHISTLPSYEFLLKKTPDSEYKHSLPYDCKNHIDKTTIIYNDLYKDVKRFSTQTSIERCIKDLTFGLEFESVKGFIPNDICSQLGLIPLRDGSISGLEYATIPLSGIKGVSTIYDIAEQLKYRTTYDDSCSLHLHIGNIPRTPSFITAFMKVTLATQDEIFSLFNLYKKYNFKYKNKNYAAPYNTFDLLNQLDPVINERNLIDNFDNIFKYLSNGYRLRDLGDNGDLSKVTHHPQDPSGNQKWNITNRYHIHNLIPLIFGNKSTIEFRIHTPTYDFNKILWFLLLNSILVNFTKKYEKQILESNLGYPLNLRNILDSYFNSEKTSRYFNDTFKDNFNYRFKRIIDFNRQSKIFFSEDELKCTFRAEVLADNQKVEDEKEDDKILQYQKYVISNDSDVDSNNGLSITEQIKILKTQYLNDLSKPVFSSYTLYDTPQSTKKVKSVVTKISEEKPEEKSNDIINEW